MKIIVIQSFEDRKIQIFEGIKKFQGILNGYAKKNVDKFVVLLKVDILYAVSFEKKTLRGPYKRICFLNQQIHFHILHFGSTHSATW